MLLHIRMFGYLQVNDSQNSRPLALRPRAQRLLVYLLLHRRSPIPRTQLAFQLWPDQTEEGALGTLRRALSELKAVLPGPDGLISASREQLFWNSDPSVWVDIDEYARLLQSEDSDQLASGVDLYTGDLLTDLDDEWLQAEREALRQKQLNALELLAAHFETGGDLKSALQYTRRALALDPFSEDTYRNLIRLQLLSGDRAAALAEYERLRRLLDEELGVEPMPETQALLEGAKQGKALPLFPEPGPPLPARQPLPIPPRLIGREAERARLLERWEKAVKGHGGMVLLSGEAGVGKSHLARNLAFHAAQHGGLPLVGHCYEFEGSPPYQAITEMLRAALSYYLPQQDRASFTYRAVEDGDEIEFGAARLRAFHTPGHTSESMSLLLDNEALFTGDTLFLDSVGRPDLNTTPLKALGRTRLLFNSLQKVRAFNPETLILPAHTGHPVPFDGIPLSATLANVTARIAAMSYSEERFVSWVLRHLPPAPRNYERIMKINEAGKLLEEDLAKLEAGANRCAIAQ